MLRSTYRNTFPPSILVKSWHQHSVIQLRFPIRITSVYLRDRCFSLVLFWNTCISVLSCNSSELFLLTGPYCAGCPVFSLQPFLLCRKLYVLCIEVWIQEKYWFLNMMPLQFYFSVDSTVTQERNLKHSIVFKKAFPPNSGPKYISFIAL